MAAGRLSTQVILVVSAFVIPRVLGAESYGLFAALMAMIAILQAASSFGLPLVEARFLAPLWQRGEGSGARALGSSIWAARLALSAAGSAALVAWLALSPRLGAGTALAALATLLALLRFSHEASKSLLLPVGRVGALAAFDFARAALTLPLVVVLYPAFGLVGAFAGLAVLQAALLAGSSALLGRRAGLNPARFRWAALRPHLPYSAAAFVGAVSAMFQSQFSIYAVANWVARSEAAFLGIALQLYGLLQVLYISARRSLMPLLSELEAGGQTRRLAQWGGVMLRYGAASTCAAVVVWSLLGAAVVRLALTEAFAPVYPCATWILVAVMFYCCAASCNGLLYVRAMPRIASANVLLYAAATVAGLLVVVRADGGGAALRIAAVHALASLIFFACAYVSLGGAGGIWLPLGRTLLLLTPSALAFPATAWEAGVAARAVAAAAFLAAYAGSAVALGLLPVGELREIARAVRSAAPRARNTPKKGRNPASGG